MTDQQILHLVFQKLADGTLPNADAAMLALYTLRQDIAAAEFTQADITETVRQWEASITEVFA